ncbi:hypothetical protein QEH56_07455 [Pelagicoccus enzymogenes]|uniref:SLC5 family protein n=1 Tax=Pelagicoccus enzymogenes TaxID=2773457 RepID=UPI00280CE1ED|nr:hypothetical protein [Pelagicoccus enzymogenes]MDQ8197978.1 hypothetical protein [Pelagicoccus enzymogenes]
MEHTFELHVLDYVSFFGYFVALSFIGYIAGKNKSEDAADYFLAGRSLPWYVVGSSYIAANISTEHFIGLIGAAVIYGISVATGEWSTVIAFSFLIWLYIPYLLTSKVYTAPEFLEKRFNKPMRTLFAGVTLAINVFAFLGPVIYGGALVLEELFGLPIVWSIVIIAVLSGFWAIWGGLKSIALMDVLTILVMVGGGLTVTFLGFYYLGDGDGLIAGVKKMVEVNSGNAEFAQEFISDNVPHIMQGSQAGDDYERLSVLQPLNHYSNPWSHWVLSFFYIGLWYTVINQHMIQKVLAAKDLYHARMGMVFASGLKLLLPFIVVVPGLIFFAMNPLIETPKTGYGEAEAAVLAELGIEYQLEEDNFLLDPTDATIVVDYPNGAQIVADAYRARNGELSSEEAEAAMAALSKARFGYSSDKANKTYILMIQDLVPPFMIGVLLAALFGAIQSTVCSVLNSTSTVFTIDFYKMFLKPNATQADEVVVGRVAGAIILALSIGMAILLATATKVNLFVFIQILYIFFAPPFSATFLMGSLWRRVSGFDALISTIVALAFASALKVMEFYFPENLPDLLKPFANQGVAVWVICMITLAISTVLTAPPPAKNVSDDLTFNWKKMDFGGGLGDKWYKSVTLWWAVALGGMFFFVILFSIVL